MPFFCTGERGTVEGWIGIHKVVAVVHQHCRQATVVIISKKSLEFLDELTVTLHRSRRFLFTGRFLP